jgi:hypothetical protein
VSDSAGTSTGQNNTLGPLAVALGAVGIGFGLFPPTFFVAASLGIAGLVIGRAGHRRCMIGRATNGRVATLGGILSGAACVLAVIGAMKLLAG